MKLLEALEELETRYTLRMAITESGTTEYHCLQFGLSIVRDLSEALQMPSRRPAMDQVEP